MALALEHFSSLVCTGIADACALAVLVLHYGLYLSVMELIKLMALQNNHFISFNWLPV